MEAGRRRRREWRRRNERMIDRLIEKRGTRSLMAGLSMAGGAEREPSGFNHLIQYRYLCFYVPAHIIIGLIFLLINFLILHSFL